MMLLRFEYIVYGLLHAVIVRYIYYTVSGIIAEI